MQIDRITQLPIPQVQDNAMMRYSLAVIYGRSIPDVRDGLKPVQRRIIYTALRNNLRHAFKFQKGAKIAGMVVADYHPHSSEAAYLAAVRMSQKWVYNIPLMDASGNNGSLNGDSPAAMRYLEIRSSKYAEEFFNDLNSNLDFRDTYDNEGKEPVVFPVTFPNILVNGASGMAVGFATEIPTHNPVLLVDACASLIRSENQN